MIVREMRVVFVCDIDEPYIHARGYEGVSRAPYRIAVTVGSSIEHICLLDFG